MASERQLLANRLNAQRSTGPRTFRGKSRSRRNALKHGLTARTIVPGVEDKDDFSNFSARIASSYRVSSALQQELLSRLTGILWRLRRAQVIEVGLFALQATQQRQLSQRAMAPDTRVVHLRPPEELRAAHGVESELSDERIRTMTTTFLRLSNLNGDALDRLTRYETALWRQAAQIMIMLDRFAVN